jgi:lipid II:glycine glycyltransferase (peptidoglycan interpeptide bridge formation enzyme)
MDAMILDKRTGLNIISVNDERWMDYILSNPEADVFHHPEWISLLERCYGYRPFLLVVFNESNELSAGLPVMEVNSWLTGRRWVSLPFSDYCRPLFFHKTELERLITGLSQVVSDRQVPRVELRWEYPEASNLYSKPDFKMHTIHLDPDIDVVEKRLKRTHRQNIKTARKRGVRVELGHQLEDMQKYYQLQLETRRRHGVPAQPWRFFRELAETFFEKQLAFVLLAYYEQDPIAGILFLNWGKKIVAKYAASKTDTLKLRPNNLLFWEGINWGCENGYSLFEFGRTDVANHGLCRYKRGWGAQEDPLTYAQLSETPPKPENGRTNQLSQSVIRKAPLWVCRFSGELLYKHFG